MNKLVVKVFLAVIVALSLYGAYMHWRLGKLQSELDSTKVSRDSVTVLADSSRAREASTSLQRDSLKDALKAADILNGKLIAAAKIKVQPKSTVDTVTLPADSTRKTFPFADTSKSGVLVGEIKVAPPPTFLQLEYGWSPFPVEFTVSLVQMKSDAAVFVVKPSSGDSVQIVAPFARIPERQKFLTSYVEALYNPLDKNAAFRAGLQMKVPLIPMKNLFAIAEGEQGFSGSEANNIYFGLRKVF